MSELVLSITAADCEMQTFRSGGKGGQHQNKRNTGVRLIHHPSGARGESREYKSQAQNKRAAFLRMIETPAFKLWMNRQLITKEEEARLEKKYAVDGNIKIEVLDNGKWKVSD